MIQKLGAVLSGGWVLTVLMGTSVEGDGVEEDYEFVRGLEDFERPLRHAHGDTDGAGVQVHLRK